MIGPEELSNGNDGNEDFAFVIAIFAIFFMSIIFVVALVYFTFCYQVINPYFSIGRIKFGDTS